MRNFPSCHVHPQSLDSGSTPQAFVNRELELQTGYITVTDHGSMAVTRQVYDLGKKNGLTPILGLEAYFRDDDCPVLKSFGVEKRFDLDDKGNRIGQGDFTNYWKYGHVTLHALDQEAYETMVRVLSAADARAEKHGSERKPLFGWNELEELGSKNITVGSGCLIGMVQRHLLQHGRTDIAFAYYERLRSMFKPGNFYVELFPHICDRYWSSAVFLTYEDGTEERFVTWKNLMFEGAKKGIHADDFAKRSRKKEWEPGDPEAPVLKAVMENRVWQEREPKRLIKVQLQEGFLLNECKPWAPDGDLQNGCNRFMLIAAKRHGDRILISDDSHYAYPDDKIVQDVRLLAGGGSWRFTDGYHRQSSQEAYEYFKTRMGIDQATFESWVDSSHGWADRFKGFEFKDRLSLPTKFYPASTPEESLKHTIALIKKQGRMDWNNPEYVKRLQNEINILHYNGKIDLLPYFFVDEEVCSLYEDLGRLTGPGRGSAAGLLLTYLLGITHVDPLRFGLSQERFITLDRIKSGKLPDIDQDLPDRDPLVDPENGWLKKRFGDHVAQISVDTTLKLRSSVKDVARMRYGRVPEEIEKLTKKFQNAPQGIDDRDFVFGYDGPDGPVKGSIETDEALKTYISLYPQDWEIVQKCLGIARQKSRHPCAYVIANEPIHTFLPLTSISDVLVTQPTAAWVEKAGGVKMDFLVINSLNDIADCIKMVQARSGVQIERNHTIGGRRVPGIRVVPHKGDLYDIWDLPADQRVFNDIAEGNTETVFQFNTPGAVQWLREFNYVKAHAEDGTPVKAIDSIEAMAAFTALDRPGPLDALVQHPEDPEKQHNMLVEYARRARGERPAETLPIFGELLPETYGIMVYQEQLQRMYQHLTGCTGAEAEEFRSNVAKKQQEKVNKAYPFFMANAGAKIGQEAAQQVWDFFQTWARYGFNKSHAVCYSVIGYACAFLKHHYPLEWWTAVLRNAKKEEINTKFWRYCGHLIDLPDVTHSAEKFEIVGERIRAPLDLLLGVGEAAHQQLCRYRPYKDIDDFCAKIKQHREDTATPVLDAAGSPVLVTNKKTKVTQPKVKLGHNALTRGVVGTMIISGAMDSLFPPETHVIDMLRQFEEAMIRHGMKPSKKGDSLEQRFKTLNYAARYQIRKKVLQAYSENLIPLVVDREILGVQKDGDLVYYQNSHGMVRFVNGSQFEHLWELKPFPSTPVTVAVVGYVVEERKFVYGAERKQACELTVDVDGAHFTMVKWPGRNVKKLPAVFSSSLKGAIVISLCTKYNEQKPFVIDDIQVVQAPLDQIPEESA